MKHTRPCNFCLQGSQRQGYLWGLACVVIFVSALFVTAERQPAMASALRSHYHMAVRQDITPEPVPSQPSVSDLTTAYLPLTLRLTGTGAWPVSQPTAMAGRVTIEFGSRLDVRGDLAGVGTRFGYIDRLCARVTWRDLPVGSALDRQWLVQDGATYRRVLDDEQEKALRLVTTSPNGTIVSCLSFGAEGQGILVPLGIYKMGVYLNRSSFPIASRIAEVVGTDPLPAPPGCSHLDIENADFELGSNIGWTVTTNRASPTGIDQLIVSQAAHASRFGALLAGYDGASEQLRSNTRIPVRGSAATAVTTVHLWWAMDSREDRSNGDDADRFAIQLVDVADPSVTVERWWSEDSEVPPYGVLMNQRWLELEVNISELFARAQFDEAHLAFAATTDAGEPTGFAIDDISVEQCTSP